MFWKFLHSPDLCRIHTLWIGLHQLMQVPTLNFRRGRETKEVHNPGASNESAGSHVKWFGRQNFIEIQWRTANSLLTMMIIKRTAKERRSFGQTGISIDHVMIKSIYGVRITDSGPSAVETGAWSDSSFAICIHTESGSGYKYFRSHSICRQNSNPDAAIRRSSDCKQLRTALLIATFPKRNHWLSYRKYQIWLIARSRISLDGNCSALSWTCRTELKKFRIQTVRNS